MILLVWSQGLKGCSLTEIEIIPNKAIRDLHKIAPDGCECHVANEQKTTGITIIKVVKLSGIHTEINVALTAIVTGKDIMVSQL